MKKLTFLVLIMTLIFGACVSTLNISDDLSAAELIQRAQEASDRNQYNIALKYYQALYDRNETLDLNITAEYEIAFIHYKQGDYNQARDKFETLLEHYKTRDRELLPRHFERLAVIVLDRIDDKEAERAARFALFRRTPPPQSYPPEEPPPPEELPPPEEIVWIDARDDVVDIDMDSESDGSLESHLAVEDAPIIDQTEPPPPLPAQYTIRPGDVLSVIAARPWVYNNHLMWPRLYEANKHKLPDPDNPDFLRPGIILDIPPIRGEHRQGLWSEDISYPVFE